MGSDAKVYTLADVEQHKRDHDCWLIIAGKVYDVTRFLEDHPGGDEALLSATGKDATDDFEDVGHSDSARVMMEEYYIGVIDPSSLPPGPIHTSAKQAHYNSIKSSNSTIKILQFLVPLAILGLAILIRHYTKSS